MRLLSENYSGRQGFPGSAKLTWVNEAAKDDGKRFTSSISE